MLIFTNDLGAMQSISDKYKKSGEVSSLSLPIEFEGRRYREIVYRETFLGKPKKAISGIIFAAENGELVTDNRIIRELLNLSYYMEIIFDDSSIESFNKAIAPDMEIRKEKRDYEEIINIFEELKQSGTSNLENLRGILIVLPQLKVESNELLHKYMDRVNSYASNNFVFTKEVLDGIMPIYRDVLLKNIQRVKYVNSGRHYYDHIKEKAYQLRKKYRWRLIGRGGIDPLLKLEHTISYFKRMLSVYEQVLNLNEAQYLKYIKNTENQNIEARQKLIRK